MKQHFFGLLMVFFLTTTTIQLMGSVQALSYQGDVGYSNITCTIPTPMTFTWINISTDDGYFQLNDYQFNITSSNPVNLTLYNIINASAVNDGEQVLRFRANCTSGLVWFNISGFIPGEEYTIKMDDVIIAGYMRHTANSTGHIRFRNSVWSSHTFYVFQYLPGSDDDDYPSYPDEIRCYRCQDGSVEAEWFEGDTCPDGWQPDIPDCDGDGQPDPVPPMEGGVNLLNVVITTGFIVFIAMVLWFTGVIAYLLKARPKPSIYWFILLGTIIVLLVVFQQQLQNGWDSFMGWLGL